MADFDSALRVRVADKTDPDSKQMSVDSDGNAHAEVHGNRADDNADIALRLSEEGHANSRGDYEVDDNSKPASSAVIAGERQASPDETHQTKRVTAIDGENDSVNMDVALHHSDGDEITEANPMFVTQAENPADEILDYNVQSDLAVDTPTNVDYTVTAAKTFLGARVFASASGEFKLEVQVETAPAAGTYNTKYVAYGRSASENVDIPLDKILKQVATAKVRLIVTNTENKVQDIHTTLAGFEK
jgi:hypothetical protein